MNSLMWIQMYHSDDYSHIDVNAYTNEKFFFDTININNTPHIRGIQHV